MYGTQDPTICKLSPIDLLRAEADAHAAFARYIGESVPQRIGEPVYVDEVGGMVLELVGACWRVPELAHTQANLSNTFAETCRYDSDHAVVSAAYGGEASPREVSSWEAERRVRDRPVFGEVRNVVWRARASCVFGAPPSSPTPPIARPPPRMRTHMGGSSRARTCTCTFHM